MTGHLLGCCSFHPTEVLTPPEVLFHPHCQSWLEKKKIHIKQRLVRGHVLHKTVMFLTKKFQEATHVFIQAGVNYRMKQ